VTPEGLIFFWHFLSMNDIINKMIPEYQPDPKRLVQLRRWMMVMGGIYVLAGSIAFLMSAEFVSLLFLKINIGADVYSYRALLTAVKVWGSYVSVIGASVLIGSRKPLRHVGLVWLVIATETMGAAGDVWLSSLGHVNRAIVLPGIPFHLITAGLGVLFLRRATSSRKEEGF